MLGHGPNVAAAEDCPAYRNFILHAEQSGLKEALANASHSRLIHGGLEATITAHVDAFQLTFIVSRCLSLLGALAMLLLVRKSDRFEHGRIFGRRSRWYVMTSGRSPALTRRPPLRPPPAQQR